MEKFKFNMEIVLTEKNLEKMADLETVSLYRVIHPLLNKQTNVIINNKTGKIITTEGSDVLRTDIMNFNYIANHNCFMLRTREKDELSLYNSDGKEIKIPTKKSTRDLSFSGNLILVGGDLFKLENGIVKKIDLNKILPHEKYKSDEYSGVMFYLSTRIDVEGINVIFNGRRNGERFYDSYIIKQNLNVVKM